jgi:hypothetical protein
MSNNFHSLLSVFHDALSSSEPTSSSRVGVGGGGDGESARAGRSARHRPPTAGDDADPARASDPDFFPSHLRERVERLLRVRQIRDVTTSSSSSSSSVARVDRGRLGSYDEFRIAICATIVDDFPHEYLWRKWMDETGGAIAIDTMMDRGGDDDDGGDGSTNANDDGDGTVFASADMFVHAKYPERIASEWLR